MRDDGCAAFSELAALATRRHRGYSRRMWRDPRVAILVYVLVGLFSIVVFVAWGWQGLATAILIYLVFALIFRRTTGHWPR